MQFPSSLSGIRNLGRKSVVRMNVVGLVLAYLILSVSASAQISRVANSSLTLPQTPQTFGYSTEDAFTGLSFDQPLAIVTPPGEIDRVFVVEKTGRIQVITNLSGTPVKQVFLDLSAKVLTSSEQGVLGLAFHPNFSANHYFYVFYSTTATTTAGTGAHQRVARFTALTGTPTNAQLLATEVPMISQRDEADNHNGGDLHFGPDGYLYVSLGDEGGGNDQFNNSQRIDKDYFSALLRLDVDSLAGNLIPNAHASVHPGTYKVPADNPFVGVTSFNGSAVTAANVRTEFWAVGLRNPWRFSFDFPTGRLLVGDVGQGAREEIDLITRGGNYGWNFREGTIAGPKANPPVAASFIDPIWDADRSTASSITGGVVYRGTRFAQLFGRYVFGDYGAGRLFFMTFPAAGGAVQVENSISVSSPAGFGTDPRNGDVLIASIGTGRLLRLVYNATNSGTPLPATLTATGAFTDLATLTPAAGVVAYDPNVSFWSDNAKKRRWFSVPALANKIVFTADGNWTFPAGTIWVKHFDLELTRGDPSTSRRLETRFIVKTPGGVYGVTYKWNTAQTEASLVAEGGESEVITINDGGTLRSQTWRYPSRSECLQCHTAVGGHALSFNTAQLNRSQTYLSGAVNQLTALANAGYFSASIPDPATLRSLAPAGDTTASLEHRARSYLSANCAQCHQPGGAALGNWDARIQTPTANAGLINGSLIDGRGDAANRVIASADLAHSMMLTRISMRGAGQMPPLASSELDTANITLITAWINALGPPQITSHPVSQSVLVGSDVTFTVVASGSPVPTLQWKKDGVNIIGATGSSLLLTNVALAASGAYTVVATNSAGSTTSNAATLTVGGFSAKSDLIWQNTATGERSIWLMNGTTLKAGASLGLAPTEWSIAAVADFNSDGKADLLWQNTLTGERTFWLMNGTSFASSVSLGTYSPDLVIAGAGDFNGDGKPDLVWQNTSTGERSIWLMNGTTVGSIVNLGTFPTEWSIAGAGDFNADGKSDLIWQNTVTGERAIWLMNGTTVAAGVALGVYPQLQISGTGDYNSDGKTDILWTNTTTGERVIWLMNGTTMSSSVSLGIVSLDWVLGRPVFRRVLADFNNDGKSDLIWQNTVTGDRAIWIMNGTVARTGLSLGNYPVAQWIAAIGDFNNDGKADLVWQNTSTGARSIMLLNGTSILSTTALGIYGTEWSIDTTGDFNGDGKPDLVWTNNSTGDRAIWLMDNTAFTSGVSLGQVSTQLQVAGAGDFNRDGKTDLLWQNRVTGDRTIWLMNGTSHTSTIALGTYSPEWSIVGTGDYNSDGKPDLLWQNTITGERAIWLMNGTAFLSSVSIGIYDPAWSIRN